MGTTQVINASMVYSNEPNTQLWQTGGVSIDGDAQNVGGNTWSYTPTSNTPKYPTNKAFREFSSPQPQWKWEGYISRKACVYWQIYNCSNALQVNDGDGGYTSW